MFSTEYCIWARVWQQRKKENDVPKKLIDVYQACDPAGFPNIHVLPQIALTLPITSCESERSFSQLKLIKTAHRSTMTTERLDSLALMKMNREICEKIYKDEIGTLVQLFRQMHPRRMKLPFMLCDN